MESCARFVLLLKPSSRARDTPLRPGISMLRATKLLGNGCQTPPPKEIHDPKSSHLMLVLPPLALSRRATRTNGRQRDRSRSGLECRIWCLVTLFVMANPRCWGRRGSEMERCALSTGNISFFGSAHDGLSTVFTHLPTREILDAIFHHLGCPRAASFKFYERLPPRVLSNEGTEARRGGLIFPCNSPERVKDTSTLQSSDTTLLLGANCFLHRQPSS